eukprot:11240440-Ditylum_brightwellii.AAC.1
MHSQAEQGPVDEHRTPEYTRRMHTIASQDRKGRRRRGLGGKKLFYVVALGPKGGVYLRWEDAQFAMMG